MRVDNLIEVFSNEFNSLRGESYEAWQFTGTTRCMSSWFLDNETSGKIKFVNDSQSIEPGYYQIRDINQFHQVNLGSWILYNKETEMITFCDDDIFRKTYHLV